MGSVGSKPFQIREETIKGTPLIYGTAMIRKDSIDIDGYSNKKTVKGALEDLAKALDKYSKLEADSLRGAISANELEQIHAVRDAGGAQYILEYEEVPGASQWNDAKDEMEYKPAKWYVHTRIVTV